MSTESSSDDGEPGFEIMIPETEPERSAYLRGLRDASQYFGRVAHRTHQIYEDELQEEVPDDGCPECGGDLVYDPSSGEEKCLK